MSKEKTDNQYLKETAHYTRRISNNVQFLFYLTVISALIVAMYKVMHTVNQVL